MGTRNSELERNVVDSEVPSTLTSDCEMNPDPTISKAIPASLLLVTTAESMTGIGLRTLIVKDLLSEERAELVPEIVTEPVTCGAVYKPLIEIVPTLALPPTIPFTDQIIVASSSPVT